MNQGLLLALTSLLAGASGIALMQDPVAASGRLCTAAQAFVDGLPLEQRQLAVAARDDTTRLQWHYVPREYPGVPFAALDATATARATALLRCVLSEQGLRKVEAIRALEDVLAAIERAAGQDGRRRDPQRYWLQFFGTPDATLPWAFRLQGHHVSLHFTVEHGKLVGATPSFFGSNPHEVASGPHRGERILGRTEDLVRGLLATLDDAQLKQAMLGAAPADVLAGPGHDDAMRGPPQGLAGSAMDALQRDLLWRLLREFVEDDDGAFATDALARIDAAGRDKLCFAWAGSTQRGQGHYFRVHGPTVWLEYDNTQDGANHVHALYRDLQRDFGGDPLREHLQREHAPREPGAGR